MQASEVVHATISAMCNIVYVYDICNIAIVVEVVLYLIVFN